MKPMIRSRTMLVVGLTGGIGSGKSTVSGLLAARGAVIVDADAIVHEVQAPGGLAFQPIVDRFGTGVVAADGTLDRPAIAAIVFDDPAALADLNALTHPIVGQVIFDRLAAEADTDHVVVLDVPLLVESGRDNTAGVIVVDCPVEVAVARAVARGPASETDVRKRIAAQATREERLAKADFVIDNSGDRNHLEAEVDLAFKWISALAAP
jgi:dephospho-CoA kinase